MWLGRDGPIAVGHGGEGEEVWVDDSVADALTFPCPCDVDHAVGGLDDGWVAEFGAFFVFEDEGGLP